MKNFFLYDPKLLLYGFLIIFFASYGQTFFISLFNTEIRKFYGLSDGEFGLVYAVATLLSSFLLISFAKLIDHLDLRLYSFIITLGFLFACLGMVLLINNIFFVLLIINLELGTGLLGPSPPLTFKVHATFSGALTKI